VSGFTAAVAAERIKLTTIRSPLWAAGAAAVLSVAVAVLQAGVASALSTVTAADVVLGAVVFGVPVLMVVAAMTVTGEYRTATIATTFTATPARWAVITAKAVVAAVFCAVVAIVVVLASALVVSVLHDGQNATDGLPAAAVRVAVYAALAGVLGVAVAALLRHTAGAVAVLLLWPLLAEPLLANLPQTGSRIGPWLPFANAFRFLDVRWLLPDIDPPWGPAGSLLYVAAVVAAVFALALVVVTRRDA
jgi:ABC-2 type transport system permease protein